MKNARQMWDEVIAAHPKGVPEVAFKKCLQDIDNLKDSSRTTSVPKPADHMPSDET